jgi:hypothetical protein
MLQRYAFSYIAKFINSLIRTNFFKKILRLNIIYDIIKCSMYHKAGDTLLI